jgi:GH25 family lysozyme M1 (1,4-beta-N-acetylmuramidase)
MIDTATLDRAPALEPHDEFEGVGAHELNPRFSNVDGYDGWDQALAALGQPTLVTPRLQFVHSLVATAAPRLDGIDVSHHNYDAGALNWQQVASIPTVWGATKATQSTGYVDPTFGRSRQSMLAIGLRHRGLYGWLSSTTDPEQQAAWYIAKIGQLLTGEFAMSDAEEAGITVDRLLAWLEAVEAHTHRPCAVYSGAYVAGGTIWTDPRVRMSKYGPRAMILAAYTTEAKALALPGVKTHPWHSWQFSSNGPVAGVTGRCDMNRVDDFAIYDLASGLTASTPTTVTEPPAPTPPPAAHVQEDTVMYFSNSEQRPATNSGPGHAWFELMPGGRGRIVTDIAEVKIALNTDQPELVTAVQRPNAWIDALLAKGPWTEPTTAAAVSPAPHAFSGTIHLDAV